jgi:hypothetical protein
MRHTDDRYLSNGIEHAFVIALRAIELASTFANHRNVDWQRFRGLAFAQVRDAEDQHDFVCAAFVESAEAHADAAICWSDCAGALGPLIRPIDFLAHRARDACAHVAAFRQTLCGRCLCRR